MDIFLSLNSGIQIDQRILTALEEGKLVLFAGAGVSNVEPSQFRSFNALVEAIAVRFGAPPLKKEKVIREDGSEQYISEELDRYLGRINDDNHRVHKQAFELLSQKPSGESSYHKNLSGKTSSSYRDN